MYITKINNSNNSITFVDHSEAGKEWRAQLILKGDKWGLDNCYTHEKNEPMIEFFDMDYPDTFGEEGQAVSMYSLGTLSYENNPMSREDLIKADARDPKVGLDLQGDVDGWEISGPCLTEVLNALKDMYIKSIIAPEYSSEETYFRFPEAK
tara:strand:+ start:549 stop:1001 length:453 start_codon:yes stop_codon:yes gene_type:complete